MPSTPKPAPETRSKDLFLRLPIATTVVGNEPSISKEPFFTPSLLYAFTSLLLHAHFHRPPFTVHCSLSTVFCVPNHIRAKSAHFHRLNRCNEREYPFFICTGTPSFVGVGTLCTTQEL